MTQHKQTILDTISLLQNAKHLLEKEMHPDAHYDYVVTDTIEAIIEGLEFDLGEEG